MRDEWYAMSIAIIRHFDVNYWNNYYFSQKELINVDRDTLDHNFYNSSHKMERFNKKNLSQLLLQ